MEQLESGVKKKPQFGYAPGTNGMIAYRDLLNYDFWLNQAANGLANKGAYKA